MRKISRTSQECLDIKKGQKWKWLGYQYVRVGEAISENDDL